VHRDAVHQLAVETGDRGDPPADPAPSRPAAVRPPLPVVPRPGPGWPLRYELRRATGVPTGWWVLTAALLTGLAAAIGLALAGARTPERTLAGWPEPLPLPPVAVAAGLLGALSFGQEFRYPALAPLRAAVPCRLSLLGGKLLVTAVAALLLSCAGVALNHGALYVLFGGEAPGAGAWAAALAGVAALAVGCAWAGLLAAGVFRSTPAGLAAVAAVPLVLAPALRALLDGPVGRSLGGLPERLQALTSLPFASGVDRWLSASVRLASQPVGWALALSVAVLSCGYALLSLRRGAR
jgi:hypothetical protein